VQNSNGHTTLVTKHKLTGSPVFETKGLVDEPRFIYMPLLFNFCVILLTVFVPKLVKLAHLYLLLHFELNTSNISFRLCYEVEVCQFEWLWIQPVATFKGITY
jgi:hypothetical protein